jgi:AraC-like DNA-binding protein
MIEPTVHTGMFCGFIPFAARHGIDVESLLRAHDLTPELLGDPTREIPLNSAAQLLTDAASLAGEPCLGLLWGEAFPATTGGVLGYLMLNARSVRESIKAVARYVGLHLNPIDVTFEEADGVGNLVWRFPPSFTAPRIQYASWAMATIVIRLRRIAGRDWMPMGVELEHRKLECEDHVRRILGPKVRYNCEANALRIRESVLNREAAGADTALFRLIAELGERLLRERKSPVDIVERTQNAIITSIASGNVTLEHIATHLELSPRVLQSRLGSSGASFEGLLQDTRQALARTYLRDTDLALTEIALLLGFSELSAFTRAATRWFGIPPSAERYELRREVEASSSA